MNEILNLDEFLHTLCQNSKVHVCIHDVSGLTDCYQFHIHQENSVHSAPLCDCAKTTKRGLNLCLRWKARSNTRALSSPLPFCGRCPLGLTELVYPVVIDGRTLCIVYVGNLIKNDTHFYQRAQKTCSRTGVSMQAVRAAAATAQVYEDLFPYESMAKAVASYILLLHRYFGAHPTEKSHWAVNGFVRYANTYFSKNINLSTLARLYQLNEKYAGRIFQKYTGVSFCTYLNQVRILHAKQLLETDQSIIDIALECGYSNISYFNRVFKKLTAQTPSQYRASINKGK